MTEPVDPSPPSLQSQFDRRAATRDAVDWVRKALTENKDEIVKVREKVDIIKDELDEVAKLQHHYHEMHLNATPNRDPIGHLNDHLDIARERKEREERDSEIKKFRNDLIQSFIKWAIFAVASGIMVVVGMGMQAQFKIWAGTTQNGTVTIAVPEKK